MFWPFVLLVLSKLICTGCSVMDVLYWLSCPICPCIPATFVLSLSLVPGLLFCHVLAVQSSLSCHGWSTTVVLALRSSPAVLSHTPIPPPCCSLITVLIFLSWSGSPGLSLPYMTVLKHSSKTNNKSTEKILFKRSEHHGRILINRRPNTSVFSRTFHDSFFSKTRKKHFHFNTTGKFVSCY
jgi:hypothetical protein